MKKRSESYWIIMIIYTSIKALLFKLIFPIQRYFLRKKGWLISIPQTSYTGLPKSFLDDMPMMKDAQGNDISAEELNHHIAESQEIPKPVLEYYSHWRPTLLFRVFNLEKALNTKSRIFVKYEGRSPSNDHRYNAALWEVYQAKQSGVKVMDLNNANYHWRLALIVACNNLGLPYIADDMPLNKDELNYKVELFNAFAHGNNQEITTDSVQAPSMLTMNAVNCQTIIGLELMQQLDELKISPDIMISPLGAGNAPVGMMLPFLDQDIEMVCVEPENLFHVVGGEYQYYPLPDNSNRQVKTYSCGKSLDANLKDILVDTPMISPVAAYLCDNKTIQVELQSIANAMAACQLFLETAGWLPSIESGLALHKAMQVARENDGKNIVLLITGGGLNEAIKYSAPEHPAQKESDYAN